MDYRLGIPHLPHLLSAPLLEKDCAVCKDQFSLQSEDPDELVVVTLPCKHPFHETCIMPWLKNSGTCPVCRYVTNSLLIVTPGPTSLVLQIPARPPT